PPPRDHTRRELDECMRESIASLQVYRTYVRPGTGEEVSAADRAVIDAMVQEATRRRPDLDPEVFALLGQVLRLELTGDEASDLVWRFQQTTGPVAAKGVEDTALYRWFPLAALNEVGGEPDRFGWSPAEFHSDCERRARERPLAMLTTASHDTKRGEDVRARLAVLSEMPGEWAALAERWARRNERHRAAAGQPDGAIELLLYQTLVGAWPLAPVRAFEYMEKAAREAKLHTSWLEPDPTYERALRNFTAAVLADPDFVRDLESFVARIIDPGRVNGLVQKLLCLTAPGVPDVYQGTDLWDLSLVDPDNRRPVDFSLRARLLEELEALGPRAAAAAWQRRSEGLPKLLVVARALRLRAARPTAFAEGDYSALAAGGTAAGHLVAFGRGADVVVAVPRLTAQLVGRWADTWLDLPPGTWSDVFTGAALGGRVAAARLFAGFPVALLERVG
ncbi:MAG: malto-oligosyltrehalose synthase, partial [Candidatus Dormibacteraeota bacterium]|nr:malto-oligosyltrehalose synthase [Candidatus Dormibacteraeota bacterium]